MNRFSSAIFLMLALLVILPSAVMAERPELDRFIVVLHDDVQSPGAIGREIAQQAGGVGDISAPCG